MRNLISQFLIWRLLVSRFQLHFSSVSLSPVRHLAGYTVRMTAKCVSQPLRIPKPIRENVRVRRQRLNHRIQNFSSTHMFRPISPSSAVGIERPCLPLEMLSSWTKVLNTLSEIEITVDEPIEKDHREKKVHREKTAARRASSSHGRHHEQEQN